MKKTQIDFELGGDQIFVCNSKKGGYRFIFWNKEGNLSEYETNDEDLAKIDLSNVHSYISGSVFLVFRCYSCKKYFIVLKGAASARGDKTSIVDYEIELPSNIVTLSSRNARCEEHPRKIEHCDSLYAPDTYNQCVFSSSVLDRGYKS